MITTGRTNIFFGNSFVQFQTVSLEGALVRMAQQIGDACLLQRFISNLSLLQPGNESGAAEAGLEVQDRVEVGCMGFLYLFRTYLELVSTENLL